MGRVVWCRCGRGGLQHWFWTFGGVLGCDERVVWVHGGGGFSMIGLRF